MGRNGQKLLDRMRRNPADWRIEDVKVLCDAFGLKIDRRPNGSHYGISAPGQVHHLTVPFARPIKRVYIRQLVRLVDSLHGASEKGE